MAQNLKGSPAGLIEAFERHLCYEIEMLNVTFQLLAVGGLLGQSLANSLIESFCIHARNLIEFFDERSESPSSASDNLMGAKHFTKNYVPWRDGGPNTDLRSRLSEQISHLTYKRTEVGDKKIGGKERAQLMELLSRELQIFQSYLREPYVSRWPFKKNHD